LPPEEHQAWEFLWSLENPVSATRYSYLLLDDSDTGLRLAQPPFQPPLIFPQTSGTSWLSKPDPNIHQFLPVFNSNLFSRDGGPRQPTPSASSGCGGLFPPIAGSGRWTGRLRRWHGCVWHVRTRGRRGRGKDAMLTFGVEGSVKNDGGFRAYGGRQLVTADAFSVYGTMDPTNATVTRPRPS
jgi:hypothetical protein